MLTFRYFGYFWSFILINFDWSNTVVAIGFVFMSNVCSVSALPTKHYIDDTRIEI